MCDQQNTLECNKHNGDCRCKESYFGIFCERRCSNGKLVCNANDSYSCTCVIDIKTVTDMTDNTLSLKREGQPGSDQGSSNHGLIFSLLGLLVVTISLSMLLFYKYKVKTRKLKRDLENYSIRYHNGGSSNDQFVNPLYGGSNATMSYLGSNLPSTYNGSSYAPSSITTCTLPHPPRANPLNGLNAHTSLTTPRRPAQNGYLNNLSLLPNYLSEKNKLADAANPMLTMSKDDTVGSNLNANIYTTIEEVRDLKSGGNHRNEFDDDFKGGDSLRKEFSSNFDVDFKEDPSVFKIPEDNESVDYAFNKVVKKNEADAFGVEDDFSVHYDKPNKSRSPVVGSTYDTPRPIKQFKSQSKPASQMNPANHPNQANQVTDTSHYDVLTNGNYETLKKDGR